MSVDFDEEPAGVEEYDEPAPAVPTPAAAAALEAPKDLPRGPAAPAAEDGIPGVELRRSAEEAVAAIDTLPLAELLSPSKLTAYLSKTIGEHQAVVDVDAHPSLALKQMMRQSLLLVLANQKILGKSHARADELARLRGELEAYLFEGAASVEARLKTTVATVGPAVREVLAGVLEDADRLVTELVRRHVDAAVDGHELVERRREVENLRAQLSVAGARTEDLVTQLADSKQAAADQMSDVKRAGSKFAMLAAGFGFVAGCLVVSLIALLRV